MGKLKRGTMREDGMVFARMYRGKETWITPQQYEKREQTRRAYVRKCAANYKRRQLAKSIMDRNYLGRYDPYTDKYFLGITSAGKEMWGTKQQLCKTRNDMNSRRKKFTERCKQLKDSGLKLGDPHPTEQGLFVILIVGNKRYYGDEKRLREVRDQRNRAYRKRDLRYRRLRKVYLENLETIWKRGERNEGGMVFWEYNIRAKEVWLTPEQFEKKHKLSCERRRKARDLKKKKT